MAEVFKVSLVGSKQLQRELDRMNPEQNRRITTPALLESMLLTLRVAAREKIFPGGKGAPRNDMVTSRSGRLRGSLRGNFAIDLNERLRFVDGGSDVVYAGVHEYGSTKRNIKARPFLAPALRDTRPKFDEIFNRYWRKASEYVS